MISEEISKKAKEIDKIIEAFLPKEEGLAKTVAEAMNYSIHVGGKRIRPMLMQLSYEMFGGSRPEELYPFMAAIEMIHTYSLCHDDLPAMDNDSMRRGKPSTHAKFGEAMGILAGDGLLNYAFETVLRQVRQVRRGDGSGVRQGDGSEFSFFPRKSPESFSDPKNENSEPSPRLTPEPSPILTLTALAILADKAGINGMIGGQVVDIESENAGSSVTLDTVKFIHEKKTAAMIESSLMIGTALAGATDEEIKVMENIGSDVGLAFQIRDDILDIEGNEDSLGKPVGSDEENGKTTYVSLVGLERAKEDVKTLSKRAVDSLTGLHCGGNEAAVFLKEMIEWMVLRDH